ncbi:protein PXR1-like [Selaginella moellendorffii]|uniref:protein PXR1-like n=1 Tax=Selaginella moellendorffii TaxID=88036 RepID=UPI000D1CD518|nr:protein PXR1-like [Selaginella moellendorffii]|eukprot:XP_024521630.1 protein PXR1-like [Selaginella moellendorffii]
MKAALVFLVLVFTTFEVTLSSSSRDLLSVGGVHEQQDSPAALSFGDDGDDFHQGMDRKRSHNGNNINININFKCKDDHVDSKDDNKAKDDTREKKHKEVKDDKREEKKKEDMDDKSKEKDEKDKDMDGKDKSKDKDDEERVFP